MKKRILSGVKIVCDPPQTWVQHARFNSENDRLIAIAKEYEKWVFEFHGFIRDHRSQDPVYLSVEREYKNICSFCGCEWETDNEGCPVCCNEAVGEWADEIKKEGEVK